MILEKEVGGGGGGEKEKNIDLGEKHQSVASHTCPNQDQTHSLDMYPPWELNLQPFWCTGQCFNQLSNLARADLHF